MAYYVTYRPGLSAKRQLISGPYPGSRPAHDALHLAWPVFDSSEDGGDYPDLYVEEIESTEPGEMNDKFPPLKITADYLEGVEWAADHASRVERLVGPAYQRVWADWQLDGDGLPDGGMVIRTVTVGGIPLVLNHDGVWEPDRSRADRDDAFDRRTLRYWHGAVVALRGLSEADLPAAAKAVSDV
jgi:hypothetical protein